MYPVCIKTVKPHTFIQIFMEGCEDSDYHKTVLCDKIGCVVNMTIISTREKKTILLFYN